MVQSRGQADCILSFELLEAARYTEYLKPGGRIIVNSQKINPVPVVAGVAAYPENLEEKLNKLGGHVDVLDAFALAEEAGSSKAVNLVLMGRLARYFDFTQEEWQDAIQQSVPLKFLEMNRKAFELGWNT